jgi:S-adenosylmethionine:tRNA ribosyltransferase-isomerase
VNTPDLNLLASYNFDLPPELIATAPLANRSDSRLLVIDPENGQIFDQRILDFPKLLAPGDVVVFNNSRVIAARLFGKKLTGGAIEILIERVLDDRTVLAQMGVSKKPRVNQEILLEDDTRVVVSERRGLFWVLKLMGQTLWPAVIDRLGHMPLPPYLQREDQISDRQRYQTVYARSPGSVAAPTAGLHFDEDLLAAIDAKGARRAEVTLHVGAGTFAPVRVGNLDAHQMHSERIHVEQHVLQALAQAHSAGRRRIAVGTTSLRTLESVPVGQNTDYVAESEIFIRPGHRFQRIDALLTNFHLPESTLLVLVSALAGFELIKRAYAHAIAQRYRFYSYGDAMLIMPGATQLILASKQT